MDVLQDAQERHTERLVCLRQAGIAAADGVPVQASSKVLLCLQSCLSMAGTASKLYPTTDQPYYLCVY